MSTQQIIDGWDRGVEPYQKRKLKRNQILQDGEVKTWRVCRKCKGLSLFPDHKCRMDFPTS